MSGFGALGVVRAQVAPGQYVAGQPQPRQVANDQAVDLMSSVVAAGDTASMVSFDIGDGTDACWIRARDVITIDVVPTEDPGA